MNTEELKTIIKELGGYKVVAEKIGVSDGGLMNAVSQDKVSIQMIKSIELLIENKELKQESEKLQTLRNIIKG